MSRRTDRLVMIFGLWAPINWFVSMQGNDEFFVLLWFGVVLGQFAIPAILFALGDAPFSKKLNHYTGLAYLLLGAMVIQFVFNMNHREAILLPLVTFPLVIVPTFPLWVLRCCLGWRICQNADTNARRQNHFYIKSLLILTSFASVSLGIIRWWYVTTNKESWFWELQFYIFGMIAVGGIISATFVYSSVALLMKNGRRSLFHFIGLLICGVAFTFLLAVLVTQDDDWQQIFRSIIIVLSGELSSTIVGVAIAWRAGVRIQR